ncbi:MAG TPA: L-threonylcarbamoyladenylate synthase [Pirellulales bacterium]|nr:L-threonylcarbamoyladenylate synthase [Pirellulales bacterium]
MKTEVVSVDPERPAAEILARAGEVLRRGGLVAFPTETVYGLGANALDGEAVQRIFTAKGRPATNPLIVHVATIEQATTVAESWPEKAQVVAARFWPGPLSLVLKKRSEVPDIVTAGGETVALRSPAHAVAQGLIRAAGVPVAAPSANLSTRISPTRAEHVLRWLDGRIDMLLDGGPTSGGLESSVIDLTVSPPRLLRPGLVSPHEIEAAIGPIAVGPKTPAANSRPGQSAVARSPGLAARHYAPTTPLECRSDSWPYVSQLCQAGLHVGWLVLKLPPFETSAGLIAVELSDDPAEYAANLYAALHRLEALALDRIVVELPPDHEAWLAVRDRLQRAATADQKIG